MDHPLWDVSWTAYKLEIFLFSYAPKPNHQFKEDLSTALVGFGRILLIFLFYKLSYTFMEFFHHLSLLLTIQTSHFINLFVFDNIREGLNEFHTLGMSSIQLTSFQALQGFMVSMYDKFFWPKVMLPSLQCFHQCIKLLVICWVVQSCPI